MDTNVSRSDAASKTTPAPHIDWIDSERAQRLRNIGTDFHLNPGFVAEVGQEKAAAFRDTLIGLGTRYRHHSRSEIRAALVGSLQEIGITVHPVELDRFADEIARSNTVTAHIDDPTG